MSIINQFWLTMNFTKGNFRLINSYMQNDITGEAAQPIERCSYNQWHWFVPELHQMKIPARKTWMKPQIQEEIPDIDANYNFLCLLLYKLGMAFYWNPLIPWSPFWNSKIPSWNQLNKRQKILQLCPVFPGHQSEHSTKTPNVQLPLLCIFANKHCLVLHLVLLNYKVR